MARKVLDKGQTAEVIAEQEIPFEEHEAPLEAVDEPAALELVTDPGPKKVIVFHDTAAANGDVVFEEHFPDPAPSTNRSGTTNRPPDGLYSIHAGVDALGPDPTFLGRPSRANLGPIAYRSRTVFRTESGGEVRSYESGSRRTLTMTTSGGEEVPFRSSMVDQVVGRTELPETTEPQIIDVQPTTEKTEDRPRRRFGFFGRKAPKPEFHADGKGDPSVTHVYQPAVVGEPEPDAGLVQRATVADVAWDPGQTTVVFEETIVPARAAIRQETRTIALPQRKKVTRKAPKPKPRKAKVRKASRKPTGILAYPGDNHPIIDIEGIGPIYAKRLEKAGIATTGQLAVAKSGRIASKVKAPAKTVKGWQAQADLLKVKGVGPQYAEAMARAGIKGIEGLKGKPAKNIAKQVTKYLDSLETKVVGQPVTAKRVAKWQRRAVKMHKVRINAEKLATPDHGIPPPWLREKSTTKSGKAAKGKTGGKKAGRRAKH